ncbi:response regulator [Thermodesulforhabdus norvegica]|uniref:Response regulatory domain-containing protein n=1 Tax=Thermodesulforhabdus norvegica TaxID=39841 RepID=A0A1I4SHN4_9BACT|nr:response regulator [Thermodesulforhabdus norvegica]SFM63969.1 hypothetical protein SAMN05660836_00970 [Thermodesulforhabdus norvegica]
MEPSGCRVLVIDRNRHVRSLLQRELLRDGHEVETAPGDGVVGGKAGVSYDIVILDAELLHGSMWNSLETLRSQSPHMVVILHSLDLPPDALNGVIPPGWHGRVTVVEKGNLVALREVILVYAECCCGGKRRRSDGKE